jgi:hypothetical protein
MKWTRDKYDLKIRLSALEDRILNLETRRPQ